MPSGVSGTLRALGLQLIESQVEDTSCEEDRSVACKLVFMSDEEFATCADEMVSMGSTTLDMSL